MNNIYKKLSVILMFLSMVMYFYTGISIVRAVTGSVSGGAGVPKPISSVGNGGGSDGSGGRQPVAYGYRISIVESNGAVVEGTHSMDYWSNWSQYSSRQGYTALTNPDLLNYHINKPSNLIYYKEQKPKTVGSKTKQTNKDYAKNTYNKEETLVSKDYMDQVSEYFEGTFECNGELWKSFKTTSLTSGGCGNGGDPRIGNNFSRYALYVFGLVMEDEEESIRVFGEILEDCGVKGNDDNSRIMNVQDKYLIVEPLTAIFDHNDSYTYVGTVYDLKQLGYSATNVNYVYNNFMYINPVVWNTKERAGLAACSNNPNVNSSVNLTSNSCAGAFTISISDVPSQSCSAKVQKAYNEFKKGEKTEAQYNDAVTNACDQKDGCSHLKSNGTSGYQIYGIDPGKITSCAKPGCVEVASNYFSDSTRGNGNKGKLATFLSETIKSFYDELQKELKKDEVYIYNTYTLNGSYYIAPGKTSVDYCNTVSCEDLLAGHKSDEAYIERLYALFPGFTALSKELRDAMDGALEPSCSTTPSCPVDQVTASCSKSGGNQFTLSDTDLNKDKSKTNDSEKCLEKGYAYNNTDSNGNVVANTVQTSRDSEYGKEGYCWESVTFDFPTSVTNVIAGQVFKWGVNGNSFEERQNVNFGTMTVKRICYLDANYFNDDKDKNIITSDWASIETLNEKGRINPEIKITYTEAVPKNSSYVAKKVSANLNVSLSQFDMYINGQAKDYGTDNNHVTYTDVNENYNTGEYVGNNPRTYTCKKDGDSNNKCSDVEYVEMIAKYNLDYGDEFKWYSKQGKYAYDKAGTKSAMTETEDGYQFIGYGLPTSFVTPTNLKLSTGESYGYSLQSDSSNGELYATVKNIGTKNRTGNTYHFDKMVQFAINDDEQNNNIIEDEQNDKNKTGKEGIIYSCGFNIKNRIFGYEDGDEPDPDDTPKGLDVVFRTVDLMNSNTEDELDKAFPGMSGNGRNMGANWAKLTQEEIFNVLDSSVYTKEPMYQITLDVSLIQNIREANRTMRKSGKDPYTNMEEETSSSLADKNNGYAGYQFYKEDDKEQTYAYSAFLYYLANSCQASKGGSCLKVSTSNPCIKGAGVHVPGCNQQWWDQKTPNIVK